MNYTQKLVMSMLVPTAMVAGAGSAVVAGAVWLKGQVATQSAGVVTEYLAIGATATALLTSLCVITCIGFTVWIRKTALQTLGGDPSDTQKVMASMADGNLSTRKLAAPEGSLLYSVGRLSETMRQSLEEIHQATQAIDVASGEIAAGNHDLSHRTEVTAGSLQVATGNMEQLVARVQESATSADNANKLAQSASEVAARGGAVVSEVVTTMDEINQSSKRIADIIGVIDGIAFQTNILALNAAVEAARAGEQGRGFAVVASEVRSLASRSAEAAKEIKALINNSVDKVNSGTRLVHDAGTTMDQIVSSVNQVGSIIHEISAAALEQSQGIAGVGVAIAELDRMTQQNAALVEESAAAAESLKGQIRHLTHAVSMFDISDASHSAHGSATPSNPVAAIGHSAGVRINLDSAIKAHADWRSKLRLAAQTNEQLDASTISRDDCCELGKWLHGAGASKYGNRSTFVELVNAHKQFHQEAGKVAASINAGDTAHAQQMLESGSGFSEASATVTRVIVRLKREL